MSLQGSGDSKTAFQGVHEFLACVYFVLCVWLVYEVAVVIKRKYKKQSFSFGFYTVCLLWTLLRTSFWVLLTFKVWLSSFVFGLLYWLPRALQCATFSLLVLFFAKVFAKEEWKPTWKTPAITLYCIFNLAQALAVFFFLIYASKDPFGTAEAVFTATTSAILSLMFLICSKAVFGIGTLDSQRFLLSRTKMGGINLILGLIFASRAVFNFLAAAGRFSVHIGSGTLSEAGMVVGLFLVWELVPTVLLLVSIANPGRGKTDSSEDPLYGAYMAIAVDQAPETDSECEPPPSAAGKGRSASEGSEGAGRRPSKEKSAFMTAFLANLDYPSASTGNG